MIPTLHNDSKEHSFEEKVPDRSNVDEKSKTHEKVEAVGGILIDTDDIGEVYDSPRLIDLGEDGKERPIRKCSSLETCFFASDAITYTSMVNRN